MDTLAAIHDTIEKRVLAMLRPGVLPADVVLFIEDQIAYELSKLGADVSGSIAFPVGVNVNACAAHWSYVGAQLPALARDDVVKVDFGVQLGGRIIDAAFTATFSNKHAALVECAMQACMAGARCAVEQGGGSNNVQVPPITAVIHETIKRLGFRPVADLCGHSIDSYRVHGTKVVPNYPVPWSQTMVDGDVFTIEPFVTNRTGHTRLDNEDVSHYMRNYHQRPTVPLSISSLVPAVSSHGTLAFNPRWVPAEERRLLPGLVRSGLYNAYAPIHEVDPDARVAHFETTLGVASGVVVSYKNYGSSADYVLA